ncbi:MAG: PCMD domain-containing protein [Bacteroidales bacterium]|nr:PCMD domain-containing protein [Bacteroidales bacterium]
MRKILVATAAAFLCWTCGAQQIYNMSFDHWSRQGVSWNPFPDGAGMRQRVWDTANRGLRPLGINVTTPEREHVAVAGPGKAAARVASRNLLWGFIAGNLYTGRFVRVVKFSGVEMYNGTPFSGRPKSLSGYYHYQPGTVDFAREPYRSRKGQTDIGQIEVALYAWPEVSHIVTTDGPVPDPESDPLLVGRAVLKLTHATDGYVHFELPIEYRSDAMPTYAGISVLSSALGEHFTGSSKTVLYVDEFRFNY